MTTTEGADQPTNWHPEQEYAAIFPLLEEAESLAAWSNSLRDSVAQYFNNPNHGDYPRWLQAVSAINPVGPKADLNRQAPSLGLPVGPSADVTALEANLRVLHPWRKGPLELGGIHIDTEWRSDLKWDRIAAHINLQGHRVLDIGSGNGYFGWRMLGAGAKAVLGIDPTLVFVMQWLACSRLAGGLPNAVAPLRLEDLPRSLTGFDTVFSMGVLYHRKSPIDHLTRLRRLVRPGGQVVLETLVVEGDENTVLVPEDRYARMRNVWFLPSVPALERWLSRAGFDRVERLDVSRTTTDEQRSTDWMTFESLPQSLDVENPALTAEGLPAPIRAVWLLR